jgi:hypothetical protein
MGRMNSFKERLGPGAPCEQTSTEALAKDESSRRSPMPRSRQDRRAGRDAVATLDAMPDGQRLRGCL